MDGKPRRGMERPLSSSAMEPDAATLEWLSSSDNPPVRYLTSRDLIRPRLPAATLQGLREQIFSWEPLGAVLALQRHDGSFPVRQKTQTAQPTFSALVLMQRCGLDVDDEPVARTVAHLTERYCRAGALSYTTSGSGVLPCYMGVAVEALVKMGGLDTDLAQMSIRWLVDHQRFDHKTARAGGESHWPYRAPRTYGCWDTVSCFHGVAAAFRAFAAIPAERRSEDVRRRIREAVDYLRIHRLYKKSSEERPLFRHMTEFFLVGDYRSDLLDLLQGVADADPDLGGEDWVRRAVQEMDQLAPDGRVPLVKNYAKKLIDPIPFEPVGGSSRFLTYQWLRVRASLTGSPSTS
jgi:hypothetical protein